MTHLLTSQQPQHTLTQRRTYVTHSLTLAATDALSHTHSHTSRTKGKQMARSVVHLRLLWLWRLRELQSLSKRVWRAPPQIFVLVCMCVPACECLYVCVCVGPAGRSLLSTVSLSLSLSTVCRRSLTLEYFITLLVFLVVVFVSMFYRILCCCFRSCLGFNDIAGFLCFFPSLFLRLFVRSFVCLRLFIYSCKANSSVAAAQAAMEAAPDYI